MTKNNFPKRGEVFWIDLDPTIGTETKKLRPCVILSNNVHNKFMPRIVAAPITSQVKSIYPLELLVNVKDKPGKIMLDQVRCFDKQRLKGKLFEFDQDVMIEIEMKLKDLLDL